MNTIEEVRPAKEKLAKQLMDGELCNSVGISKDEQGYFISVGLVHEPTPEENATIPTEFEGVRVITKVVGRIYAYPAKAGE